MSTSHRLTRHNVDKHWARAKYVKLENLGRPAKHRTTRPGRHRMTRATLRRHRASQKRASRIRVHRPTRPMWARALQAAATWVF